MSTVYPTRASSRTKSTILSSTLLGRATDTALTLMALVSIAILVVAIASAFKIVLPLVVTSNSMTPTFAAGDLIIAKPVNVSKVNIGDVVTAPREDGVLVTHRVTELTDKGIIMKGDANKEPDAIPYSAQEVMVPAIIIPKIGWAVAALNNNKFIAAAIFSFVVLAWALLTPSKKSASSKKHIKNQEV